MRKMQKPFPIKGCEVKRQKKRPIKKCLPAFLLTENKPLFVNKFL